MQNRYGVPFKRINRGRCEACYRFGNLYQCEACIEPVNFCKNCGSKHQHD